MSQGLLDAIVAALLGAGALEVVASVFEAYVAWERAERPVGRQRKHADKAAAKRAWYQQSKAKRAGKGDAPRHARVTIRGRKRRITACVMTSGYA
jgi:hypothetical protein